MKSCCKSLQYSRGQVKLAGNHLKQQTTNKQKKRAPRINYSSSPFYPHNIPPFPPPAHKHPERSHNTTTICWSPVNTNKEVDDIAEKKQKNTYDFCANRLRFFFFFSWRFKAQFSVKSAPSLPEDTRHTKQQQQKKGVWFRDLTQCRSYTSPRFCYKQTHRHKERQRQKDFYVWDFKARNLEKIGNTCLNATCSFEGFVSASPVLVCVSSSSLEWVQKGAFRDRKRSPVWILRCYLSGVKD